MLNSGHHVEVFDIWAGEYTKEEVVEKIKKLECDIIGISALSTQYSYVKWLISELRKIHDCPIVVGNALATFTSDIVLKHTDADICVIGEGEITFKELVENLDNLEKVKGICFKRDGEIIRNEPRDYIKDLDTIDFPEWDLFPVDVYLKYCRVEGTNTPAFGIVTGRGCPYNCRYCSKTFHGYRNRSIDNIIQEIKLLIEKYNIKGVFFLDELVVINKERIYELCDKLEPLHIKWNCTGRVNLVDFDILKRMKKAGCVAVGYGVESGSQTILDNMNKQMTTRQSERAIRDTVKLGMLPIVMLMYGYPGENKTTLQETAQFLTNLPYIKRSTLSVTTVLPGSWLWDYAISRGMIKNEEKYLEQLDAGYMHDGRSPLINFTGFTEEEFYRYQKIIERALFINKLKRHPNHLLKDYLFRALTQYRRGGFKQLAKRSVRFMRWVG